MADADVQVRCPFNMRCHMKYLLYVERDATAFLQFRVGSDLKFEDVVFIYILFVQPDVLQSIGEHAVAFSTLTDDVGKDDILPGDEVVVEGENALDDGTAVIIDGAAVNEVEATSGVLGWGDVTGSVAEEGSTYASAAYSASDGDASIRDEVAVGDDGNAFDDLKTVTESPDEPSQPSTNGPEEIVLVLDSQSSSHHLDVVLFSEEHAKKASNVAPPAYKDTGLHHSFVKLRLTHTLGADCVYLHTTSALRANPTSAFKGKQALIKALKAKSREIVPVCRVFGLCLSYVKLTKHQMPGDGDCGYHAIHNALVRSHASMIVPLELCLLYSNICCDNNSFDYYSERQNF